MNKELKNAIIITLIVILIVVMTYFMSAVFMTGEIGSSKDKTTTKNTTENNVSNDFDNKIIASKTFLQSPSKYMVIFISAKDISNDLKNAITSYNSNDNDLKLYVVNLDEVINSYAKSSSENKSVTNGNDLKVKAPTLIKIENKQVSSYVSDNDDILNLLK